MNLTTFKQSLTASTAPLGLDAYLESLWYDAKENWGHSHNLIQDLEDSTAAWIHAYLHRKEGDLGNADYWYRKAGRKRPAISLREEWETLVNFCLQK